MLLLDILDPPAPDQLVADLRATGAGACGLYVLRRFGGGGDAGIGTWTPAHVAALRADGIALLPIIVPGNNPLPSDVATALDVARALGVPVGAMDLDLEQFSLPPVAWVAAAIAELRAAGWRALRYGDEAVLAGYPPGDGDWVSHASGLIVRAGVLLPVPAIPPGYIAWQYAVEVNVNGRFYDASVFDPAALAPPDPPPAPLHGGSSGMTIALAARPDGSGVDSFEIISGQIHWSGDVPDWQPGSDTVLPGLGAVELRAVAACWDGPDRLVVDVLDAAGTRHRNVIQPSNDWKAGSWEQLATGVTVPAAIGDLVPGPAGPAGQTGPPGTPGKDAEPVSDDHIAAVALGAVSKATTPPTGA